MEEMSDKLLCISSKVEWEPDDQMSNLIEKKNTIVGHYCETLLWDTIAGHYCGTLSWDTIVGHYCETLLLDTIVRHYCETLL